MQWTGAAAKVRLYINTAKKSMLQIQKETGCDIIINGGLFSGNFKPVCHLKVGGQVLARDQYTYWGYGWADGSGALKLITDYGAVDNYICCVCLVRDGKKEPLYYDSGVGGARPRTAIGTMPDGQIWVYIGSNPCTPEALRDTAMMAGVRDAVMLDGGGSTQGILPNGTIVSPEDRKVHNYICIWTKKEGAATMPTIKQKLSHSGNYGDPATGAHVARSASAIRFLVLHYTGNDGDSDEGNGNYFHNNKVKASCHYFVDDDSITQSVPDSQIAWHCGGKAYYHPNARNANSIGIELCDNKKDGTIYPSQATIDRALELTRWLMQKYNIPASNVIRHWDVTHKLCPAYWCGTTAKDALWRSEFWSRLSNKPAEKPQESAGATEGVVTVNVPVLKRGSTGATVRAVQAMLVGFGYNPNGVDGSFGPGCEAAVKKFQAAKGLTADGIVGAATWKAMLGV